VTSRLSIAVALLAVACAGGAGDEEGVADAGADPDAGDDPGTDAAAPEVPALRVLSYNIKHAELSSLEALAEVILAADVDLVALQEVDKEATRSGGVHQAFRLGQLTGMAASFRRSIVLDEEGGEFGLAVLSRHPIISSDKIELTSTGEQRIAAAWQIELEDGFAIELVVTHLGLDAAERSTQAAELADFVSGRSHLILAGDFNEVPDGGDVYPTITADLADTWVEAGDDSGGFTIPVSDPDRRIDYVFATPDWGAPLAAEVLATDASDHLPVLAAVPRPVLERLD
jgi:endonuclease/exonuclease/phosphatase family metal-dependent hydrolase